MEIFYYGSDRSVRELDCERGIIPAVMEFLRQFRLSKESKLDSPVKKELMTVEGALRRVGDPQICGSQGYLSNLALYLDFAQGCGLDGESIVLSCRDLAETLDPVFRAENFRVKEEPWLQKRRELLAQKRESRSVEMQLDPEYFAAISSGEKRYEGRALNPNSPKNYSDLRREDKIIFTINQERPGWKEGCQKHQLLPGMVMETTVGEVYFAPSVHSMYEYGVPVGAEFQPWINGASELLELQRVAVYYSFPEYPKKIQKYGFLGIELLEPRLM